MESKWFTISENKRSMKMSLPAKVLTEGTAKQEMDNNGRKFSYIAQATGKQKDLFTCGIKLYRPLIDDPLSHFYKMATGVPLFSKYFFFWC